MKLKFPGPHNAGMDEWFAESPVSPVTSPQERLTDEQINAISKEINQTLSMYPVDPYSFMFGVRWAERVLK